jgi:hypothetical protein
MRRKKIVPVVLLMAVFVGIAAYAGSQLMASHEEYAVGDDAYAALVQLVITEPAPTPAAEEAAQAIAAVTPAAIAATRETTQTAAASAAEAVSLEIPARTVDYTALRSVNADAIGWLYCPDTVIDYPVMGATDYTYYLRHLPDGTYNINGSLFLDYNCQWDFSDKLSVIYGHNMKTEKMFGTLVNYKKQEYYDAHPYLYLYTPARNYRIALLYGAVVSADRWGEEGYAWMRRLCWPMLRPTRLSPAPSNTPGTSSWLRCPRAAMNTRTPDIL